MLTERIVKKIATYLVFASFFTPLVIATSFFTFPYIVPKALLFRSLIVVTLGLVVPLLVIFIKNTVSKSSFGMDNVKKLITNNTLPIAIILFTISTIISTCTGVDWFRSFFGNQERMMGTLTFLHYVSFFFILLYLFKTFEDWKKVFTIFSIPASLVICIGIIQKIFPHFLFNRGAGEVVSTLGNPIYLAGLGLFTLYLGLLMGVYQKGRLQKYFFSVSVLGFIGILISGTRGTLLAALISLVMVGIMYLVQLDNNNSLRKKLSAVLLLCFILVAIVVPFRNSSVVKNIPIINEIASISATSDTGKTRLMAWNIALTSVKDYPLFGWGPNNFYYAFNKYYNPEFLMFGWGETWFDSTHNEFLNVLNAQGIVGFIIYLSIFYFAFRYLQDIYKLKGESREGDLEHKKDDTHKHIAIIGGGFLIGHIVHNMFVFENLTSLLYFVLFLAFITSIHKSINNEKQAKDLDKNIEILPISIGLVLAIGIVAVTNVNVAIANNHMYHARGLFSVGRVDEALIRYEKSHQYLSPYQEDGDWDFASDVLTVLPQIYFDNSTIIARDLYDKAVSGTEGVIRKYPNDVRARLLYMDLLRSGGLVLFELPVSDTITEQLAIAKELSPNRQQIEYAEITFLAGTGKIDEAIGMAKDLIKRDEKNNIAETYYTLARLYLFNNEVLKVAPVLDYAILNGVRFTDPAHMIFLAETYDRIGRFEEAMYWYQLAYNATNNNVFYQKAQNLSRETQKLIPTVFDGIFASSLTKETNIEDIY